MHIACRCFRCAHTKAMVAEIKGFVATPADRAVDAVLGSMMAENHFDRRRPH